MSKWIGGLLVLLVLTSTTIAGDMDDGIAIDESINDDINLDINVSYITVKALNQRSIDGVAVVGQGNLVIMPGARIPLGTDIINISNIKGATAISR